MMPVLKEEKPEAFSTPLSEPVFPVMPVFKEEKPKVLSAPLSEPIYPTHVEDEKEELQLKDNSNTIVSNEVSSKSMIETVAEDIVMDETYNDFSYWKIAPQLIPD